MTELLSHPDQTLRRHLSGILEVTETNLNNLKISLWKHKQLYQALTIAVIFHDFAKSTTYFQQYITSENKHKTSESSHTRLSAVVSFFVAKNLLEGEEDEVLLSSLFVCMAVRRHHGNIRDFISELNLLEENKDLLLKQSRAIQYDQWNQILTELSNKYPFLMQHDIIPFNSENVETWINEFHEDIPRIRRWIRRRYRGRRSRDDLTDYFQFLTLYSLLLDGDKSQAALRELIYYGRKQIPSYLVDRYKQLQNWEPSALNRLREQAYIEATQNILGAEGRLFSLNLPTGMGKTITSFNVAVQLRERRKLETGIEPRIIYALPFLSVIDQNHAEFERIMKASLKDIDYTYLLKHHSLVDPYEQVQKNKNEEELEYDFDQSQILVEGWNGEVVCTTFVQVFQTLLTNSNHSLRKFHRLANCILVLDEIQAIPVKYWRLMRQMILTLNHELNTDVIILTATEPKIFEREDHVVHLCDRDSYFKKMNRMTMIPKLHEEMTVQEFVDSIEIEPEKTYLFILNTIGSAKEMHCLLKRKTNEAIGFLSTHLVPKQRLERIREIQDGKYRIVVSTQLVEAGVDMDFNIVYRDLAPLDSINQSAGRCNRHQGVHGQVFIVHLVTDDEKRKTYARFVYDKIPLNLTNDILKEHKTIEEPQLLELIENYFEKVKKSSASESDQYLSSIRSLYFTGEKSNQRIPIADFRLIEEDYEKIDVFVELDDSAAEIWNKYCEVMEIKDGLERYKRFAKMKKYLHEYVVSIPYGIENRPPLLNDQNYYVSKAGLEDYYDSDTGFITKGVVPIW